MAGLLPDDIAIIALGPSGVALGHRLRAALPGARLHGPSTRPAVRGLARGIGTRATTALLPHIADLFAAGRPIVGLCASGILIRSVAPLLADKHDEPPVVAVAEDGSVAVPLRRRSSRRQCSGPRHRRADGRRRRDHHGGRCASRPRARRAAAGLADRRSRERQNGRRGVARGEPVALGRGNGGADWLRAGGDPLGARTAVERVLVTDRASAPEPDALVFHPPVLALGIGCERGCPAEEIAGLARSTLARCRARARARSRRSSRSS